MTKIFLDESGDLGFSKRSSNWFILTIVLTNSHRRIENVIKRTHRGLKKKYKRIKELHAYNSNVITRKRILNDLVKLDDIKILCIILNKKKVYTDLQN